MVTVYRSTDSGAPLLTYAADSLNTLLKSCLVDGYGAKPAAGWTHTVLDAATNKYAFSQGAAANKAIRHIYLRDPALYHSEILACASFTVSATPILTTQFGSYNATTPMVMLKVDQTVAGGVAEWFMVADSRRFLLMAKRENWSGYGWAAIMCGDVDSPYPNDKGAFSLFGRSTYEANMTIGCAPEYLYLTRAYCFGESNGVPFPSPYEVELLLPGSNYNGKHGFGGVVLSPRVCKTGSTYRGLMPFILFPVHDGYAVSPYLFNDGQEVTSADGRVFRYIRNGLAPNSDRFFVQVGGFDS